MRRAGRTPPKPRTGLEGLGGELGVGRTGAGLPRAAPSRASAWENLEGLRGYLQGNSCRSTDGTVDGSVVNGGVNGGGVNCGGEAVVVRFLCKLVLFGIRRSGHVTIMGQGSEINMHNYGPVLNRTVRSGPAFSQTGLDCSPRVPDRTVRSF